MNGKKLCVVGAGQMGSQIAALGAMAGWQVRLQDLDSSVLEKAMASNRKHLQRRVDKGRMAAEEFEAVFANLRTDTNLQTAAEDCDFVIEAVVEKLDVKKKVFQDLDRICPKHAILATNSSYLGNSQIAVATKRPDRVVNMHFFFPPLVMKLVEVVRGTETSEATLEATVKLARAMGKTPVLLHKEMPGFLVNRILRAITNEAYSLLDAGVASFEDIDLACEQGLNHPLGPFRLSDFSGLDIGYLARQELFEQTGREQDRPPEALARRVQRGDLGRKSGRGFYDYSTSPPTPTRD